MLASTNTFVTGSLFHGTQYMCYTCVVSQVIYYYSSICIVCVVFGYFISLLLVFVTRLFLSSHPRVSSLLFPISPPPSFPPMSPLLLLGASVSHSNKGPTQGGEFKKQLTDLMRTLGGRRREKKRGEEGRRGRRGRDMYCSHTRLTVLVSHQWSPIYTALQPCTNI